MPSKAETPEQYFAELPDERKGPMNQLRQTIIQNLPKGFEEVISYGMPGYVVPHSIYPDGYHCDPKVPLPFLSIASQKNFIALYHMGLYSMPELLKWWEAEYAKAVPTKLDMGKSCVRLKKMDQIPYDLIGELISKVSVEEWIAFYEGNLATAGKKK